MLVTPRQAAKELYVSIGMIGYWIRKGRLRKHPTGSRNYLVDLDEARRASKWNRMEGIPDNLITVSEAAEMIMRVDDIITCAPRQREAPRLH
jgi:transposase